MRAREIQSRVHPFYSGSGIQGAQPGSKNSMYDWRSISDSLENIWCTDGVRIVYGWCTHGVRVLYGYCADRVRMVYA